MNARWLGLLAAVGASFLAGASAVGASCGVLGPSPTVPAEVATAKVAFVGLVISTSDMDRSARVKVESIWNGPVLPAYVEVHGEAPGSGPFSGSEGDHRYQAGQRYLFIPLNENPPFADNGDCNTSTQVYTAAVAAYAPADAKTPEAATPEDAVANFAGQYSTAGAFTLVAVAALGTFLLARRRRSRIARQHRRPIR
jgi:hypothetical protein